jgi:hypothetical protein
VPAFADAAAVDRWMASYYLRPEPSRLEEAIGTLEEAGALRDEKRLKPVAAFIAGAVAGDGALLDRLTERIAELSAGKRHLLLQAVALSGRSDWRRRLMAVQRILPERSLEIDTLLATQSDPATLSVPLDDEGLAIDMYWAHFNATGSEDAIRLVIAALGEGAQAAEIDAPQSRYKAKRTLAVRAGSDERVLQVCRHEAARQAGPVGDALREIVAAAASDRVRFPGAGGRQTAVRAPGARQG